MRKARFVLVAMFALALLAVPATASAKQRDRDHDGMPDKWEKKHHLSVHKANAKKDADKDGLKNIREFKKHTDPQDADTDNDGLDDGDEVQVGDNPRDGDTDNDGVEDGDEFGGTIQSFDSSTGVLTILLADGQNTVQGAVTDGTRIECDDATGDEAGDDGDVTAAQHGDDEVGDDSQGDDAQGDDGDNSGPGSDNSGDDGDDGDRADCTTADLTEGRVVHEAKLTTDANGDPVFTKVELDK
jgi:hypothetical protein